MRALGLLDRPQMQHELVALDFKVGHGRPSLRSPGSLGAMPTPTWPPPPGGTWVVDLDGVVWLAGKPIPGVDEAVARLRGVGVRVLFATNNALPTRAELHRQLAHCGITADDADLLRSADVAAGMLAPGSSAVVLGGDGVLEALAARGVLVVPEAPADAVVVGLTRDFTYDALTRAVTAVRDGARLVGTNEDATYPTPDGLVPGAGAILAAVETAAGHLPRWRASRTARRRTPSPPGWPPGSSGSWWGTAPRPTAPWPPSWASPLAWSSRGSPRRGRYPPTPIPAVVAPDLLRLVDQALGGATGIKVLAAS